MRTPFVPVDFTVPAEAHLGEYSLHTITTKDTAEDVRVLTANADAIVQQRGGTADRQKWPYVCSFDEDLQDLAWLEICAKNNQLFSYILRTTEEHYAGCLYIYPIELFYSQLAKDYDVDFSFWITQELYDAGQYEVIFGALLSWLRASWPFDPQRIYLRNAEIPADLRQGERTKAPVEPTRE